MLKTLKFVGLFVALAAPCAANAVVRSLEFDTEDPMYLVPVADLQTQTGMTYMTYDPSSIIRMYEKLAYGVTDKFVLGVDIFYQHDFDRERDDNGFSNIGINGIYRVSGNSMTLSDALFGVRLGGDRHIGDPEFGETLYYAGLRIGRQKSTFTLAGTIKTSWIFDEANGMAFIDLMPEVYVRILNSWKMGLGFDFRKATTPQYDRQWLNYKTLLQFGRTQYVAEAGYEFKTQEYMIGARLNILF